MARAGQPSDGDERAITLGWLAFHRDALAAKGDGLSDAQLVERAGAPSKLSLLGLIRHLTEMERAYGTWALGPKSDLEWVYGVYDDDGPEWDMDCDASMVGDSMHKWESEKCSNDRLVARYALGDVGTGNGHTMRWNLQKLVGEYARHNGHADILREGIDGQTGE